MNNRCRFGKIEMRVFWITEIVILGLIIYKTWWFWNMNPFDRYCFWHISHTPDFFRDFFITKVTMSLRDCFLFLILSSGNLSGLFAGKLKFLRRLHPVIRVILRIVIAIVVIIAVLLLAFPVFDWIDDLGNIIGTYILDRK